MRTLLILIAGTVVLIAAWLLEPPRQAEARVRLTSAINPGALAEAALQVPVRVPPEASASATMERARRSTRPGALSPHGWLIRGEVLDAHGRPVEGIEVGVPGASDHTSARGRFSLRASRRGTRVDPLGDLAVVARQARTAGASEQRLVVAPAMRIAGRVLDADEHALGGAQVVVRLDPEGLVALPRPRDMRLASAAARSNADGSFELERVPHGVGGTLYCALEGHGTVELALPTEPCGDLIIRLPARLSMDEPELEPVPTLRQPPAVLAGVLVDLEGRALAGWRVSVLRGAGDPGDFAACETDSEGAFVIPSASDRGIEEQELWLEAWNKAARTTATLGPLASGSKGIVFTVAAKQFRDPSSASVVSTGGQGLAGARVSVAPLLAASDGSRPGRASELRLSGRTGGFELTRAPQGPMRLTVSKPGFEERLIDLLGHEPLPTRIELSRLCDVTVHAGGTELALAFLDGTGAGLAIREAFVDSAGSPLATLGADRTGRFLVAESARTLIVYADGAELYRQAVRLSTARANTFRP